MSSDLLRAIMAGAATAARERAHAHGPDVERMAAGRTPRGQAFRESLTAPGVRVIAECKRRSPSRGVLRAHYDPAAIARGYAAAGAAAVSVLTEASFFDGALAHLDAVRAAVEIPVLRKDFISEVYQLVEARAAGADAILLIVAGLDDTRLTSLLARAEDLELAALVEVHSREELHRAASAGAAIIGVNSRNLRTLQMDLTLHEQVMTDMPRGATSVAESGLTSGADLRRLGAAGYDAFLIGERFMTLEEPASGLATLLREGA
jgi:indole-3-glycerol phosphate synthase